MECTCITHLYNTWNVHVFKYTIILWIISILIIYRINQINKETPNTIEMFWGRDENIEKVKTLINIIIDSFNV